MKQILLWASVLLVTLSACYETTVGYLITKNASYDPDTTFIRKTPDPVEDAVRIEHNSPWVTLSMQGYEGTDPIIFSVESVSSPDCGEEAARIFMEELTIRGGGALLYPLQNKAKPGTYVVSVRLTNDGYSQVVKDCYTFIVKP